MSPTGETNRDRTEDGTAVDETAPLAPDGVPAALDRIETATAGWIDDRADEFDPFRWETVEEHEMRRRACSEAALSLHVADRVPAEPAATAPALRETVVAAVDEPAYRRLLARHPERVGSYAYPVLFAEQAGALRDDRTWETLGDVLAAGHHWAPDRVPYALMDAWHLSTLYGAEPRYGPETILPVSCLDPGLDPFRVDVDSVYALTHVVMFYRGFGMAGYGFPPGPAPYDAALPHRALALRFLAEGNHDATLELLCSGVLQHDLPPDLVAACLDRVLDEVDERGHLRDDPGADDADDGFDHLDDRTRRWATAYHVNLVAGYATRTIRAEWDALRAAYAERDVPASDPGELHALGDAVRKLAAYDLEGGARALRALAGRPVVAAFPGVFDAAVEFLRGERRPDGEFGYWAEERMQFVRMGYEPSLFEERLLAPTTEACREALEAIEATEPPARERDPS